MSDGREWRWVDPSGGQHTWRVDALRSALQSGSLPPNTLVWCEGMTDWLPASQVPELNPGLSIPEVRAAQPTLPGPGVYVAPEPAAAPEPPPPPGGLKTRVGVPVDPAVGGLWAPGAASGGPPNAGTTLLGVPPPSPGSGPMPPNMARGPIHAPPGPPAPSTASPPQPPPRQPAGKGKTMVMGPPILDPSKAGHPIVVPGYQATAGKITKPAPFSEEAGDLRVPMAPPPPEGLSSLLGEAPEAPEPAAGEAAPRAGEGLGPGGPADAPTASTRKHFPRPAAIAGAAALGAMVLIGGLIAALGRRKAEPVDPSQAAASQASPSQAAATQASPSSAPAASGSGAPASSAGPSASSPLPAGSGAAAGRAPEPSGAACAKLAGAKKLAPKASKDLPLELVVLPGGSRAALGYSVDGRSGQGLEIDLAGLGTSKAPPPRGPGRLRRVLPVPAGGKVRWVADGDVPKAKLQKAQTVPLEPSFLVGLESSSAVATAEKATGSPQKAWSLPGDATAEVVRAIALPGEGALVAVKAREAAFAGLLGADRSPKGELAKIAEGGQVGTPSLAAGGSSGAAGMTAVALAFRAAEGEPWSIKLAKGEGGAAPGQAQPFAVPAGGPGQDAMGPSITALSGGRWLLAWTEGKVGARVVRAATLGPSFDVIGEPLTISLPDGNAGQATVAAAEGKALVVYLLSSGKAFELWGASLSCP